MQDVFNTYTPVTPRAPHSHTRVPSRRPVRRVPPLSPCRRRLSQPCAVLCVQLLHREAQRSAATMAPVPRPLHPARQLPRRPQGAGRLVAAGHRAPPLQRGRAARVRRHPRVDGYGRQGAQGDPPVARVWQAGGQAITTPPRLQPCQCTRMRAVCTIRTPPQHHTCGVRAHAARPKGHAPPRRGAYPDAVLTPTRCLPDAVLLGAVVCGQRVLRKEPKGRDVDDTDEFHYDASFKHNLFRIKINSIQMRENEQENEQVHARARPAPCPPEPELSCAMVAYAFAARARRYCASQPTHAPRIFGPVRACVLPLARVADDGRRRSASSRTASIKSTRRSCAR